MPGHLDAYYCVLVTREYWRTNAEADHLRARECLEGAVKLDPNYAEAWAMLAMVYGEEHLFGYNLQPDPIGRAFGAAQRAISLDPNHQRAQESLAQVYFYRNDIHAFFPQAERAVSLNPNNEDTVAGMGLYMTYIGMNDPTVRERGLAFVRKAMALNPSHPGWYHFPTAWSHWWKQEYDLALAEANKINQPDLFWTYVTLAMIYGAKGQNSEAAPHIVQLKRLYPDFANKVREEAAYVSEREKHMMIRLVPKVFFDSMGEGLDLFADGLRFKVLHQDSSLAVVGRDGREGLSC